MKKAMLLVVASIGAVLSALSQGSFYLDNSGIVPGLTADRPGNWYSGTFGMEVWELNTTTIPAGINLSPGRGSGILGYDATVAAGFVKERTFAGRTTAYPGAFVFGEVDMLHVAPAGATVVLALAAWNTGDASWSAMLANANAATRCGVVAFVQPTADLTVVGAPPSPKDLVMDQDLVMCAIPEPTGPALAGLGAAVLLARRSRRPRESESRVD